jgi:hypothetical protein
VNINDQNRKHWDFYFQARQELIDRQRRMNAQAAQAGQDEIQRQVQTIQDDLLRQREQDELDFQRKVNKNQRKDQKRLLKHRQHEPVSHKLAHAVINRYEEDEKFRRFINEGIKKGVTALKNEYKRRNETAASENAHSSSAGFPIVDYPVEVTWDDPKRTYRMVKNRKQP